jgi:RNA polymerase sigma-70 factor (ECF subfamily)
MQAALRPPTPTLADVLGLGAVVPFRRGEALLSDDEAKILQDAASGNAEAFRKIFAKHRSDVQRLVFRMMGARGDLEDVIQEVFIQVFRSLGTFRGDSRFSTWLHRVTVNVTLMHIRALRSRPQLGNELLHEPAAPEDDSPADGAARAERLRALYKILDTLSEKKRAVFILHDIEGIAAAQVAKMVESNVLTVRTRLFYARRELEQMWKDEPTLALARNDLLEGRKRLGGGGTMIDDTDDDDELPEDIDLDAELANAGPSPLTRLLAEAKSETTGYVPPAGDFSLAEQKLLLRLETEIAREKRSRRSQLAAGVVASLALAAGAAFLLGRPVSPEVLSQVPTAEPLAFTVVGGPKGGNLRTDSEDPAGFVVGDTVEVADQPLVFERSGVGKGTPRRAMWALDPAGETAGARIKVAKGGDTLVLTLERGAVEADVTPVRDGEAFAVDVAGPAGTTRVAVHGTHLRVAKQGNKITVDLTEGVIALGAPSEGRTTGREIVAPAHVELEAGASPSAAVVSNAGVRAAWVLEAVAEGRSPSLPLPGIPPHASASPSHAVPPKHVAAQGSAPRDSVGLGRSHRHAERRSRKDGPPGRRETLRRAGRGEDRREDQRREHAHGRRTRRRLGRFDPLRSAPVAADPRVRRPGRVRTPHRGSAQLHGPREVRLLSASSYRERRRGRRFLLGLSARAALAQGHA